MSRLRLDSVQIQVYRYKRVCEGQKLYRLLHFPIMQCARACGFHALAEQCDRSLHGFIYFIETVKENAYRLSIFRHILRYHITNIFSFINFHQFSPLACWWRFMALVPLKN